MDIKRRAYRKVELEQLRDDLAILLDMRDRYIGSQWSEHRPIINQLITSVKNKMRGYIE